MTSQEPRRSDSPRPAPRPGPRPGPRPTSRSLLHPVAAAPASDPHRFGRVDDDGTVWLITASGERVIGSWQAGDSEAAFAHFGRRFDDLSTEVALLEERLATGTGDARKIKATASALAEALPTANVLGDVDALAARLTAIREHAESVPAVNNIAQRRPRARRRWPPRPKSWPPIRRSGKPPVTGCAPSSRSGKRSPEWTAKPTMCSGSATPRPARCSTVGGDRISPSWTGNAPGPVTPRSGCV